jgi:hypothetical protein
MVVVWGLVHDYDPIVSAARLRAPHCHRHLRGTPAGAVDSLRMGLWSESLSRPAMQPREPTSGRATPRGAHSVLFASTGRFVIAMAMRLNRAIIPSTIAKEANLCQVAEPVRS